MENRDVLSADRLSSLPPRLLRYYDRARYYDPRAGRFISQDPLGYAAGDINLYRYCQNSPTNATDPSGMDDGGGDDGGGDDGGGVLDIRSGNLLGSTMMSSTVNAFGGLTDQAYRNDLLSIDETSGAISSLTDDWGSLLWARWSTA